MTVANTALPSTAQCQPMSCRTTILSGLSYKNINKNNVVLVFLGGFSTSSDNGSNALGILLKSTNIGTTSCQLNITVYDQINLDTISVYYIAFGSGYIVTPNFVYQGTQTVGCVYSTATCTPFPASNNSFSIGTSFTFYSVQ